MVKRKQLTSEEAEEIINDLTKAVCALHALEEFSEKISARMECFQQSIIEAEYLLGKRYDA
jgi:polyhydroxyalkanoate synthesis regulator phasin